jgi:hypothetical protein
MTSLDCKDVVAAFDAGQITSDAGALLMREADRDLGLLDALDEAIEDTRDQRYTTHEQRALLAQRIFGIDLGYEDLNDHEQMREDPALKVAAERRPEDEDLSSPSTLCRLENRVDRESLWRISEVLVDAFIGRHSVPPRRIVLDVDATDDVVHGEQQKRFFHGFYRSYCFMPLYVFCGDALLAAYLRPANSGPSRHARAIVKMLVAKLRSAWPETQIIVRGDSGFCRWRTMRWCENHGVDYIFGIAKNDVLKRKAADWLQQAREGYELTGNKQTIFGEFQYAAGSWERERRVIAKAEHLPGKSNPRFVVTSLGGRPERLYRKVYCQRGEMENRIKEQQLGLFADRTSCTDFLANQFRLLLASAAYVLIEHMREKFLAGTELENAQVGTIRLRLLKIGALVKESVRRVAFHMASGYPLKDLFSGVLSRMRGRPAGRPLLGSG